jgi:hypothetical protein
LLRTGKKFMKLYQVKGGGKSRVFKDLYDAIDYKDLLDAHYINNVVFKQTSVWNPMTIYKLIMDENHNPLRVLPKVNAHAKMQTLALMWSTVFGIWVSSFTYFGISALAHVLLIAAIVYTYGVFNGAQNRTGFDLRPGYHSVSRTRQSMWINGKRIELDPNDPGGEHE